VEEILMIWPVVCFDADYYAYVLDKNEVERGFLEESVLEELIGCFDSEFHEFTINPYRSLDSPIELSRNAPVEVLRWRSLALETLRRHGRLVPGAPPASDALTDKELWQFLAALP
jgi:hypothetical protein